MRRGRNDSRRVRHDLRLDAHSHWIVPEQELLLVLMHGFAFYSHFLRRTATSAVTEVGKNERALCVDHSAARLPEQRHQSTLYQVNIYIYIYLSLSILK